MSPLVWQYPKTLNPQIYILVFSALKSRNKICTKSELVGVAGSFSRSAVNYNAGVCTAMSNVVMSIVVLVTLLVLTPLFKYTPNAILSAIIISAVISLIDGRAAWMIWKIDKFDFLACLGAFVGVFFVSVEIGLLIAVSVVHFMSSASFAEAHLVVILIGDSLWNSTGVYLFCQNSFQRNTSTHCSPG